MTEALEKLAMLSKTCGDVLRLQMLRVLSTESLGVLELTSIFEMRQPAMSHHLKVLSQAGLVSTRKEGNTVFYRRSLPPSYSFLEANVRCLLQTVDKLPLPEDLTIRLDAIHKRRSQQSKKFFSRFSDKKGMKEFRQHQELIADHDLYAKIVSDVIENTRFPSDKKAIELGPGEGEFLEPLKKHFQTIFAVDNSQEMLTISMEMVRKRNIKNVIFVHGEIQKLHAMKGEFDCIVANMVLHHVPSPGDIFHWASVLLKPGGSFLVSDLSHHNQQWAKDSCGDLWLGFSTEELNIWAKEMGMDIGESQYLGLRNGFQIQVRRFFLPE